MGMTYIICLILGGRYKIDREEDNYSQDKLSLYNAGCIYAAKMIRLTSTLTARNYAFWKVTCERLVTPSKRKRDSIHIDILSQNDPIYCAGAEVGPALKSLCRQYYSLEGLSRESVVQRYSNQYLTNTVYDFSNR